MSLRLPALVLSGCLALSACASTDHGTRQVGQLPEDQSTPEASLRREFDELERRTVRSGRRNADPALNAYVRDLGCAVAGEFCDEMRFYIIETPEFNASMAPNGMMLVNTGLLLRVETESELAFVMAHEFGHYFENHITERLAAARNASRSSSIVMAGLSFTGVGALLALGYTAGALADVMEFSREQEREADMFAARFANEYGYNAAAGARAWVNLSAEISASSNETTRRRFTRESAFASHPLTEERIAYLRASSREGAGAGEDHVAYRALIRPFLQLWLEAENANRDAGATLALLDRLAQPGLDLGVIEYARGEVYRSRGDDGDAALALASFTRATEQADCPPQAWRQIGVMYRHQNRREEAIAAFEHYLALSPDAADSQLIGGMIETLRGDGT